MSTLSIVGVVTKPPREDPRDSVLPAKDDMSIVPSPAPLGGDGDAAAGEEEPAPDATASSAPAEETAAVPVDEVAGSEAEQ
jgi:hypothetical protein